MSRTIESPFVLDLERYAESIKSRRSINLFEPELVPDSLIQAAIEVARWAPNHKKTEPWYFHILGPETRRKTIELITEIKSAGQADTFRAGVAARLNAVPGWLVITCDVSEDVIRQMEDFAACSCAAQNLMLYLWAAGVGVKWTTGKVVRDERLLKILGIDTGTRMIVGLFWYGYPGMVPEQTRKPVTEISTVLD